MIVQADRPAGTPIIVLVLELAGSICCLTSSRAWAQRPPLPGACWLKSWLLKSRALGSQVLTGSETCPALKRLSAEDGFPPHALLSPTPLCTDSTWVAGADSALAISFECHSYSACVQGALLLTELGPACILSHKLGGRDSAACQTGGLDALECGWPAGRCSAEVRGTCSSSKEWGLNTSLTPDARLRSTCSQCMAALGHGHPAAACLWHGSSGHCTQVVHAAFMPLLLLPSASRLPGMFVCLTTGAFPQKSRTWCRDMARGSRQAAAHSGAHRLPCVQARLVSGSPHAHGLQGTTQNCVSCNLLRVAWYARLPQPA